MIAVFLNENREKSKSIVSVFPQCGISDDYAKVLPLKKVRVARVKQGQTC
jgi:hypothetical protein